MAKTKFDIKLEATRPLYVGVGVTDLAVEAVRDYVADVQKRFVDVQKTVSGIDLQPQKLRVQATHVVNTRVEAISKDAKARREAIEARVADLQSDAQALVTDGVETVTGTYTDLAKRGEKLVVAIRKDGVKAATAGVKAVDVLRDAPKKSSVARRQAAKKGAARKAPASDAAAEKAPGNKVKPVAKQAVKQGGAKGGATTAKKTATKNAPAKKATTTASATSASA